MTSSSWQKKEQDLIENYESLKPGLEEWGRFIDDELIKILKEKGFDLQKIQIPPKHRIKENDSLIRKAFYRDRQANDPLLKIEDKVGTRIVVTTLEDLRKVRDIVLEQNEFWESRESRSLSKSLKNPKEFDYQSVHVNLTPKEAYEPAKGLTKNERKTLTCELQIRTLLQHAFAEVAHDTIYKGAFRHDSRLVRLMSRSMALMEATDEYFEKCFEEMRDETVYEKGLIKSLLEFSNERLGIDPQFSEAKVDWKLTSELLKELNARDYDVNDIKRKIIQNEEDVKDGIKQMNTYLKGQPVLIFLFFLILEDTYKIKEHWFLEEDIIKDLFYKLGIGYG